MLLYERPPNLQGLVWPVVATQDDSSVTLTFSNSVVARSYEYSLSTTSANAGFGAWTALASTKIITGLTGSTTYWIKVRTVHGLIKGPQSRVVTATTDAAVSLIRTLEDTESDQSANGAPPLGTTSSFTPADNSLLVVVAALQGINATPGTMSISDSLGTLTWTARVSPTTPGLLGNYYGRTACWTAPVTSGAAMTVSVTSSENNDGDNGNTIICVLAYENYDTGSPIGGVAASTVTGDADLTITLNATPASDSEVVAWRARGDGGGNSRTATPGSGWTEVADLASVSTGYCDLQVMVRTGSTSTDVTWDDTSDGATEGAFFRHCNAIEIKAA